MAEAAWRALLEDEEVREWHDKLSLNSALTADERGRILHRYCTILRTTPAKLVGRAKDQDGGRRNVERELQDFVVRMRKPHKPSEHGEPDDDAKAVERCRRGHAPGYVENFTKSLRSWFDHNDITLRRIIIGDTDAAPTVENEVPLTPLEIRDVLSAASLRGRVVVSLVALAGLRPEVLGTRRAEDGLTIGDLPDLELKDRTVRAKRTPLQVVVRRELSKVKRKYFSFIPSETSRYVVEYLEHRLARGEDVTNESPLLRPDYNRERQGRPAELRGREFLTTQAITSEIRDALRARGLSQRPYALRSYFIQRLESAERDGKISPLDRMFFSGRKDSIDLRYSHFKALPQSVVEELRAVYVKCEPYLGAKAATLTPAELPSELQQVVDEFPTVVDGFRALVEAMSVLKARRKEPKLREELDGELGRVMEALEKIAPRPRSKAVDIDMLPDEIRGPVEKALANRASKTASR